jgi:hypothetical protein
LVNRWWFARLHARLAKALRLAELLQRESALRTATTITLASADSDALKNLMSASFQTRPCGITTSSQQGQHMRLYTTDPLATAWSAAQNANWSGSMTQESAPANTSWRIWGSFAWSSIRLPMDLRVFALVLRFDPAQQFMQILEVRVVPSSRL